MGDIEVIHVWSVKVRHESGDLQNPFTVTTTLLITTGTVSIKAAISKAQTVIKEKRREYRKAVIRSAEYEGEIDA